MIRWLRKRTPADAARELSAHARVAARERVKARARAMREDMGLPPLRALR